MLEKFYSLNYSTLCRLLNQCVLTDKTVFIWGGVRALERLSVQLCAVWGVRVTCVAPRYTHEYLLSLGAAEVMEDEMAEVERIIQSGRRLVPTSSDRIQAFTFPPCS